MTRLRSCVQKKLRKEQQTIGEKEERRRVGSFEQGSCREQEPCSEGLFPKDPFFGCLRGTCQSGLLLKGLAQNGLSIVGLAKSGLLLKGLAHKASRMTNNNDLSGPFHTLENGQGPYCCVRQACKGTYRCTRVW